MIFPELLGYPYASLMTFRKNGEGVATPIWFATDREKLYILTTGSSGKVKRIRHTPRVQLAPCSQNGKTLYGPYVDGVARVMAPDEYRTAKIALNQKYGLQKSAIDFLLVLSGRDRDSTYLEIVPA